MRPTRQPDSDAPVTDRQRLESYQGAVRELHQALSETVDILEAVTDAALVMLDTPEDMDAEAFQEVCVRAQALVESTRKEFELDSAGSIDITTED